MIVLFIFGIIVLVGALISALARAAGAQYGGVIATGLAVFGLFFVLISGCQTVGTKEIGVPTTFGKVGSTHYGAGPHWWVSPWTTIHEMDGAIQTDDHISDNDTGGTCFSVRLANLQTGCADVSLQWRINPTQVDYLYQNYRSFDHVKTQLVDRKLFAAVNEALASYNPLNGVDSKTRKNQLIKYQSVVYRLMKQKVRDINGTSLIEIKNVQLPIVHFDSATQQRVNQLQQQVAQTLIAQQEKKTNEAKSLANAALEKGNTLTELVLVSRCYDTLGEIVKAGDQVPAGFSCWPGGSLAGVIAGSTGSGKP